MPRTTSPLTSALSVALLVSGVTVACSTTSRTSPDEPDTGSPNTVSTNEPTDPLPPEEDAGVDAGDAPVDPDEAQVPVVDGVSPDRATVGSVGPSVIVSGANFVPRSIVQLDGAPLATTFVNDGELRATIPTSKLATVGTLRISVGTSAPGGGASKEVLFQVENPLATVTSLSPLSVLAGSSATSLHVVGTGFVGGTKIVVGTDELPTTFVSATELETTLPAGLLAVSGSLPVRVRNPAPGGGDSDPLAFTVSNPDAGISSINPSAAFVGSASLDMTVDGHGFVGASVVTFNGTSLATTFVNGQRLRATVPSSLLGAAGDFPVGVTNPPPGGGVSTPVVFRIQYPAPSATNLSPDGAMRGAGATDVTVTGVGFFVTSQITLDGAPVATTYVDATHLKATIDAARLKTAGTIAIRVVNSAPGGGTSSALAFVVSNPGPAVASLSPSSVQAGAADTPVTITGSGFVPNSTVTLNGATVASTYVSATKMQVTVPSGLLVSPGVVAVRVTNPSPGGGTSDAANFTIGCDTSGVDVSLGSVGTPTSLATNFLSAPVLSAFDKAGSCDTTVLLPGIQEPGRYWVVQNVSGATATLAAWADCTNDGKGDAFLTFYKRPTPPANDDERLACAFVIAEGINGQGGYSSPDSGGSMYCPGLTKANGGGLVLGACEKAVVHIQAYDVASTAYTAPPSVKVELE